MSARTESKTVDHYLSLNYRVVTYRDEDGDYIAEAEGLPGCVADGSTAAEAHENLRMAMRSWFESRLEAGLDIYEPKTDRERYSGRLLLRIPKYLHRTLANQARFEGVSLNQYLLARLARQSGVGQPSELAPEKCWRSAVSQAVRQEIYNRAGGRCECEMTVCGHRGRCTTGLHAPYWDAHHRNANGPDTAGNLIAMCATCHKNTRAYGRS